ncbi:hypothetical protein K8R04_04105 [Candidatus Uhrbacteria bacterium]|nr:hypothetical protein [Candidatus Uhrbacteria bacterium]
MPRFARSFFLTLALLIGGWMLSFSPVLAAPQINNQINYQARLMDASGFPVADGNYSIIFSLYDASTAGTRLWTASGTVGSPAALTINVQNGLFTVLLGDTSVGGGSQNTLDTVNWNSDQLYLGVTINADSEMTPRKRFASAPQAFNARQLQGMYASSTASGGQTLFTVNQTEANSATGTRTALDVRSNGTSSANDFLIRGINDLGSTVFSVNRQGNATTSFLNASSIFASMVTSTNLQVNIASFATATVMGSAVCLANGVGCPAGTVLNDTLQSVTARGSFTTTTAQFFGGFVAASSSVTGTLAVLGNFHVTGSADIYLTSTSSPFTLRGPQPASSDFAQALTYHTTGTEGFSLTNLNQFGFVTYTTLNFAKDLDNVLTSGGARINYANEFNQLNVSVSDSGSNATLLELTDNDNMYPGFGAEAAMTIRKYTNNATSSLLHLWNLGSNLGQATLNVGTSHPNGLVSGFAGSIYFRNDTSSGTQAYLNTSGSSSSWVGIATVDMLGSGTSSGPETDTLQSVTSRGSFTTTTAQFFGGFVAASSSVTGTLNVMGNVHVGAPTTSLNSAFVQDGNDLYVEGNIGSASSIYTNGELVIGPSSTHYGDGFIKKLDGMQELTPPITYGFLMQMTGSLLVQATPDTNLAIPGDIAFYAGDGTSTLQGGSAVSLQGGAGYNDGTGGYVSITGGLSGTSTFAAGGGVYIAGGPAVGDGSGGGMSLTGADTFGAGNGGSLSMTAGTAYGTGSAGTFTLTAGSSFGVADGGSITLSPGISIGGRTGNLVLQSGFGYAPPEFRLAEDQSFGSDYVGFRAPTSVVATRVWILPDADGSSGQVLSTDGLGNLSFVTAGGGSATTTDYNWIYNNANGFVRSATATNDIVLGSTATSTGAPVYFDMQTGTSTVFFGFSTNTNVVIGGTSSTPSGMPLFTLNGNDLLVTGGIGTDTFFASGRADVPYLNRWFTSPLLTQTVYKGGSATTSINGTSPRGVVFDGSHIWVTDYVNGTNNLFKVDPLTNTVVATTTVGAGSGGADGMAFDGKYIWVANGFGSDNNVSKVNPVTNRVEAVVALGGDFLYAQSVAFDGTYIWVTETGTFPSSSVVRKVDPVTNSLVASVPVGVNPYGIAFDGKYLWVANSTDGTLSKIDPVANTVVATTTVGGQPIGVVFDGTSIWVTTNFTNAVVKVNPITNTVITTLPLGGNPQYGAFDGRYLWFGQSASSSVSKIDPTTNSIVETIDLHLFFGNPVGMAFDGSHMWIATPEVASTISKIPVGVGTGYASSSLTVLSLMVNAATGTATGTSNYAATIRYASSSSFGGLCVDDTNSGPTCPTNPGASIVADGAIIANRFDIAEMYSVTGTSEAGDVLVLDASSTATVMRSTGVAYDSKIIGIVSTDPGFILGWNGGSRVALAGRVPVKVSMNSGSIQVGDALVSSDVPGYAMKATQPGMILGYALESVSATGTAQVFVSVGFWAGLAFGPTGQIQVDDSGNVSIMNDLHIGGKLFPSLKGGGIQNDWYLFVNADDPTSTYISTNAAGFMSMDTYDFAERYYSPDELEAGDLVVVSDNGRTHVQRSLNEDQMLLGIVSTRPAFIAGRPATSTYPIALSGRVPTKVSNMNGAIKAGDPLAPTTIPGVAAKAVRSGPIIGLALEDFESANIEKIEVYVNPSYWVNEHEVVTPSVAPEISSETVLSDAKQGYATIAAGSKRVHVSFDSIGAYPNVQVTLRGLIQGNWGTDGYSDTGFDIIMSQEQTFDAYFSWRVEPLHERDRLNLSDGTTAGMDPITGLPYGFTAPTSSPEISVSTPTESISSTSSIETPPSQEIATSTNL